MPPVSAFYQRRRRLAWIFAIACGLLSLLQSFMGFRLETFSHPRISPAAGAGTLLSCRTQLVDEESIPYTRLLALDSSLGVAKSSTFQGALAAVFVEGEDTTAFFESSASLLRGGDTVRRRDLGQAWAVRDAVLDRPGGEAWIFGWHDGKILTRRRAGEGYSEEIRVADCKTAPAALMAAVEPGSGPLVAWREEESRVLRTAAFAKEAFASRGDFDLQPREAWSVAVHAGRVLLVSYRPEERTARAVTIRLRCCAGCGLPPPPERIVFEDPFLLFGRSVTGLSAAVSGDRLVLALARETVLQAVSAPAASLLPEPGSRLLPVGSDPLWRRIAGYLQPRLMFFSAFALIFLGASMFREQRRIAGGQPAAEGGLQIAVIPQRAMAVVLDFLIVYPAALIVLSEIFSSLTEGSVIGDARWWTLLAMAHGVNLIYHVIAEAATGTTLGKWIVGLRVRQADGAPVTARGALLRNLLRPIEAEGMVLLGGLVMANSARRQRLGDLLGRTIVVQDPPTPASAPKSPADSGLSTRGSGLV